MLAHQGRRVFYTFTQDINYYITDQPFRDIYSLPRRSEKSELFTDTTKRYSDAYKLP